MILPERRKTRATSISFSFFADVIAEFIVVNHSKASCFDAVPIAFPG